MGTLEVVDDCDATFMIRMVDDFLAEFSQSGLLDSGRVCNALLDIRSALECSKGN